MKSSVFDFPFRRARLRLRAMPHLHLLCRYSTAMRRQATRQRFVRHMHLH